MNSAEMNEDEIDTEALQAQIDLSMSFAQNLVSSWIEPQKYPSSSRRKNVEQELVEYIKRPPRLGVGAAIPEGVQSMTRETARLKGKLAGSKHPLEEPSATKSSSDDEGERRAFAIKKKTRLDPFDPVHGKKRKKNKGNESGSNARSSTQLPALDELKLDSSDEIEGLLQVPDRLDDTPVEATENLTNVSRRESLLETSAPSFSQLKAISPSPSDEQEKTHAPSRKSPSTSQPSRIPTVVATSSITRPKSNKSLPLELLKVPLLNLNGLPSNQESEYEPMTATPSTTTKKKRKRRKKKKNYESAENPSTA
ncbi:hypothetical protein CPB84DRAFT_1820075 [Gymnopilus junonius]|uniref:Uncharacterized protein n=1 Tax=Gymnopilus junonius TaxID=109634 RepID=A0A9P5TU08_GYMJU|nr:hypothetical protein CPB84DRAFT_1820075 [Gymnopilus junonius]